jgi:hypothetical protein
MSRSALSAKAFAVYLFIVGSVLVVSPNFLLSLFRMPATNDVWIHVVGVIAFNLGGYAWVAAKHQFRPFLEASVYTRVAVFVIFAIFVAIGLAGPTLIVFGVVDLCGALWTYLALKADMREASRGFPADEVPAV